MLKEQAERCVVCINNEGYPASLEKRKIIFALRDPTAERHGLIRVVDKSGGGYLYPKIFFRSIVPLAVRRQCWPLRNSGGI